MFGFYIYRKIRPYDYEAESAHLPEFLHGDKVRASGLDTTSLSDFEKWKIANENKPTG